MKNTTLILCCLFCAALLQNVGAQTATPLRQLREVSLSGSGYKRGLQHGQQLKKEIGEIVAKWKKSVKSELNNPADQVVKDFFAYAHFDATIKAALRAKDDPGNPVCQTFNGWGGTFGSVVMTLTGSPKLQITAGPPDESEYKEVQFSKGKRKTE